MVFAAPSCSTLASNMAPFEKLLIPHAHAHDHAAFSLEPLDLFRAL
jgi:hypothetical protein